MWLQTTNQFVVTGVYIPKYNSRMENLKLTYHSNIKFKMCWLCDIRLIFSLLPTSEPQFTTLLKITKFTTNTLNSD